MPAVTHIWDFKVNQSHFIFSWGKKWNLTLWAAGLVRPVKLRRTAQPGTVADPQRWRHEKKQATIVIA